MALSVTHAFQSTVAEGATSGTAGGAVGPSEWNAAHTISGTLDAGSVSGGAALTRSDDTNVTLTLGGTPTSALLAATSITVGWTGTLALSRLAQGTDGQIIVGQTGAASAYATMSGDATLSAAGALTIGNAKISYAKIQNVAASRVVGNPTGSPAAPSEISLGATLAFSGTALQTAAITGDVTASANSFATTIGTAAVSYAKFQNVAALSVVGRSANTSGVAADITGTDGQVLRVSGTALGFGSVAAAAMPALTGDVTTGAGAVATTLTDTAPALLRVGGVESHLFFS